MTVADWTDKVQIDEISIFSAIKKYIDKQKQEGLRIFMT